MSEWEYFRNGTSSAIHVSGGHVADAKIAYRVGGDPVRVEMWDLASADPGWSRISPASGNEYHEHRAELLRRYCPRVDTEHEAIHGEPRPVHDETRCTCNPTNAPCAYCRGEEYGPVEEGPLFYAAWKKGEADNRSLGKPPHPAAYQISEGRLWHYGSVSGRWNACGNDPDNEYIQKCIAYFKANYAPCTEAEAIESIGIVPAEPAEESARTWYRRANSSVLTCVDPSMDNGGTWTRDGYWGTHGHCCTDERDAEIPEPDALALIREWGWPMPPGVEHLAEEPPKPPAPVQPKFKVGTYIVFTDNRSGALCRPQWDGIGRVLSNECGHLRWAYADGTENGASNTTRCLSLWQPAVGEKVWCNDVKEVVAVDAYSELEGCGHGHDSQNRPVVFYGITGAIPAAFAPKQGKPAEEPEPERPAFEVGQYINALAGIAKVVSGDEYVASMSGRKDHAKIDGVHYLYADGHYEWDYSRRLSPWQPAVGEKVWIRWNNKVEAATVDELPRAHDANQYWTLTADSATGFLVLLSAIHPDAFAPKQPEQEPDTAPEPEKPKFEIGTYWQLGGTQYKILAFDEYRAKGGMADEGTYRFCEYCLAGGLHTRVATESQPEMESMSPWQPKVGEKVAANGLSGLWIIAECPRTYDMQKTWGVKREDGHCWADMNLVALDDLIPAAFAPEQVEPAETQEPEVTDIEREQEITGRAWWVYGDNSGVHMRAGGNIQWLAVGIGSHESWESTDSIGGNQISETAAIAWMSEHDVPWPAKMGPRCWIRQHANGYYYRAGNPLDLVHTSGTATQNWSYDVEGNANCILTSEPLARAHCGMGPLPDSKGPDDEWPVGTRVRDKTDGMVGAICTPEELVAACGHAVTRWEGYIPVRFDEPHSGRHCWPCLIRHLERITGEEPTQTQGDEPTDEKDEPMSKQAKKYICVIRDGAPNDTLDFPIRYRALDALLRGIGGTLKFAVVTAPFGLVKMLAKRTYGAAKRAANGVITVATLAGVGYGVHRLIGSEAFDTAYNWGEGVVCFLADISGKF